MARSRLWSSICVAAVLSAAPAAAAPDPVLEWIKITNDTIIATSTSPLFTARDVALVAAAQFDAVNGIDRRLQPIHFRARAPRRASERAAAIQAAYGILVRLFPSLSASLMARRDASIAAISTGPGADSSASILAGAMFGQAAADDIWSWRSTDGFDPNPMPGFLGSLGRLAAGVWRPTPKADGSAGLSGAAPQFATMTPWILQRSNQFRPAAPYASPTTGQIDLTNAQYVADYLETKTMGSYSNSPRTKDQSDLALFWAGNTALFWNRIALTLSAQRQMTLQENAHLFALLNLAMADAAIACWDAKFRFVLWRPITAVREGALEPDPAWKPWLDFFPGGTPAHPEFPSGHSTVSGGAVFILAAEFGDSTPFSIDSDVQPGTRSFPSFSAALEEIHDARVFGGIHWRTACRIGSAIGQAVAEYVSTHAMAARDRGDDGQ